MKYLSDLFKNISAAAARALAILASLVPGQQIEIADTGSNVTSVEIQHFTPLTGDVIVQLFEWTWKDIEEECRTFLPQHGYTAVQTSPVTEHAVLKESSWSDRYQPFSYKIISRSGNEEDFRNMVKACHENKIKVYVDVVVNHMSRLRQNGTVGTAGSRPNTREKTYPDVPYGPSDFHESCPIDYNEPTTIRTCELGDRHDLNQTKENVRNKIVEFLNKLIDIGVAGFRVSDAKYVAIQDLEAIFSRVKNLSTEFYPANSRPFIYYEVSVSPKTESIPPTAYLKLGFVESSQFSKEMNDGFYMRNSRGLFKNFESVFELLDWNKTVLYIEDPNYNPTCFHFIANARIYKEALGFMFAWPHAVSRVMSGYKYIKGIDGPPSGPDGKFTPVIRNPDLTCSGGWKCEHRWPEIYNMIHFRKTVFGSEVSDWWASNSSNQVAFCRKGKGFIAINVDEKFTLNKTLQTRLPSGTYCDVISGSKTDKNSCSGKNVTVGADGQADIQIKHDAEMRILAIHTGSKIG